MPDTPPEVGSLWLHESGERRFVVDAYNRACDDEPEDLRIGFSSPNKRVMREYVSLPDWHAWAAKARRIDNGAR